MLLQSLLPVPYLGLALPVAAITGRALFYMLVISTTTPGEFFWRNKDFIEHARVTGLADMPQLGVVYDGHHKFNLQALLGIIRSVNAQ